MSQALARSLVCKLTFQTQFEGRSWKKRGANKARSRCGDIGWYLLTRKQEYTTGGLMIGSGGSPYSAFKLRFLAGDEASTQKNTALEISRAIVDELYDETDDQSGLRGLADLVFSQGVKETKISTEVMRQVYEAPL